ncbi:MAG: alpha/beta hydrolase [Chloroflexi bacterium]|nr:alpha/beta hydrolase [Chloroflexota bacterium]
MESKFVLAGPVRLEYFEHGHGPDVLVLVHGYASSAAIWRYTLEHLPEDRFRVIVLNNRGAGKSDRAFQDGAPFKEDDYSVETFADDLFHVVEALKLDGFTLVGHSMGGATVAQFALAHQDRIKGLALLNSTPLKGRDLKDGWEDELRESLQSPEPPAGDMGFNASHVTEDFKQAVMADIGRNPVERFIGGRRSMAGLRLRDRLNEINVPTLVIGGDRDKTVGVDNILADYLALPQATRHLHICHGIGHSPNVEVPRSVGNMIGDFSDMASLLATQILSSR